MRKLDLTQYIKENKEKLREFDGRGKESIVIKMEVAGMFKQNISDGLITPKTIKKSGKTLYAKGLGIKSIVSTFKNGIIKTGSYFLYMGAHLDGVKKEVKIKSHTRKLKNGTTQKVEAHDRNMNIPKRDWLIEPKDLKKTMIAWINKLMVK